MPEVPSAVSKINALVLTRRVIHDLGSLELGTLLDAELAGLRMKLEQQLADERAIGTNFRVLGPGNLGDDATTGAYIRAAVENAGLTIEHKTAGGRSAL